MADIDFGQLSEALNDKADRDLHNVDTTAKADAVIDYQEPTSANNYTWYRKYKSGWVEQGGFITRPTSSTSTVTFPLEMQDTNYYVSLTSDWSGTTGAACAMNKTSATTKTMSISKDGSIGCWWQIKGMAA